MRDYHAFAHGWMSAQNGFNFTQFNPEAANFHLIVCAAQEFQSSIFLISSEISGAKHPRARLVAERIRDKPFSRQFRMSEIATREPGARNIKLATNSNRHRLQITIENISRGVVDRPADWNSAKLIWLIN